MYGLSAALGKAGAVTSTQVFQPAFYALVDKTGDSNKAQGYVFIIGSCISVFGALLTFAFES